MSILDSDLIGLYTTAGAVSVATGQCRLQPRQLILTSSNSRLTLQGTASMIVADFGLANNTTYVGKPKAPLSFTIPNGYFYDVLNQAILQGSSTRATLSGTATWVLYSNSGLSRIALTGQGF